MSGKKTILLDLDLRKPKVHLGFNHDNTFGMSSLIVNNKKLEECIKHSEIENLDFITAGPIPPNPSELLLSTNYKLILEQLKEKYDVIITDNPPIGLVSDGIKNLSESDIPIYVFKSNFSKRNYVFRLRELIELKQVTKLNVILNSVDNNRRSNYGYGYYEENEKVFTSKKPLGRRIIDFFRQ
jgi:capsular exopolysaccharide synthesis family protein